MHQKHTTSCFEGTLNGWNRQSPQKKHVRQSSLLHQLQQNLNRYEDQNNRMIKSKSIPISKLDVQQVRLPLLTHTKINMVAHINGDKGNIVDGAKAYKGQDFCMKNVKKALPLRMKTLMIYERNQNQIEEGRGSKMKEKKEKKEKKCENKEKEKFRKKVVINFERIKEIGRNFIEFSDERFFKDMTCMQQKSKSVKLYPVLK